MEAKELRLGNWVKANGLYEGSEMQVEEIGSKGSLVEFFRVILFKDNHAGEFIQHIEGIPLTEEWLINLGLKYYKGTGNGVGYYVAEYPSRDKFRFSRGSVFYDGNRNEIKYVHQLQNLYFALTGKELTLNK